MGDEGKVEEGDDGRVEEVDGVGCGAGRSLDGDAMGRVWGQWVERRGEGW